MKEVNASECRETAIYELWTQTGFFKQSVNSLRQAVELATDNCWEILTTAGDIVINW